MFAAKRFAPLCFPVAGLEAVLRTCPRSANGPTTFARRRFHSSQEALRQAWGHSARFGKQRIHPFLEPASGPLIAAFSNWSNLAICEGVCAGRRPRARPAAASTGCPAWIGSPAKRDRGFAPDLRSAVPRLRRFTNRGSHPTPSSNLQVQIGCPAWIRTRTRRVKVACATITPPGNDGNNGRTCPGGHAPSRPQGGGRAAYFAEISSTS